MGVGVLCLCSGHGSLQHFNYTPLSPKISSRGGRPRPPTGRPTAIPLRLAKIVFAPEWALSSPRRRVAGCHRDAKTASQVRYRASDVLLLRHRTVTAVAGVPGHRDQ